MKRFFGLDACLVCGSIFIRESTFCRECEGKIAGWMKLQSRRARSTTQDFQSLSLFRWYPGESDFLSQLLLKLKGPHQMATWSYLARQMALVLIENQWGPSTNLIVTCCPSKTGEKDHSWNWASGLAKAFDVPFVPLLRYQPFERSPWRFKSRRERWSVLQRRNEVFTQLPEANQVLMETQRKNGRIVFADDIVTTGATASLAFESLGKPRNFTHLALADRSDIARKP